jgi:hypothetical protein
MQSMKYILWPAVLLMATTTVGFAQPKSSNSSPTNDFKWENTTTTSVAKNKMYTGSSDTYTMGDKYDPKHDKYEDRDKYGRDHDKYDRDYDRKDYR